MASRRYLQSRLGTVRFSAIYGSAEVGIVAWQANVGDPLTYHFRPPSYGPRSWKRTPTASRRLVLTNLVRTRFPILRYDSGDVGRIVSLRDSDVVVELQGRAADSFDIGGNYYAIADFADVVADTLEFQIQIAFDTDTQRGSSASAWWATPACSSWSPSCVERLESDTTCSQQKWWPGGQTTSFAQPGAKVPALIG